MSVRTTYFQESDMVETAVAAEPQAQVATVDAPEAAPVDPALAMRAELLSFGIVLILFGLLGLFGGDAVWSTLLIGSGLAGIAIRRRGLFIVYGLIILLTGLMNLLAGEFGIWTFLGLMQLGWGISEIGKYKKYA